MSWSGFEKGKDREEKIDKFLDTMAWYFSEKRDPIGFYSTIGRIEEKLGKLNENAERFIKSIDDAGKSSEKLTRALNKITLTGVIVATVGILVAIISLAFEIYKYFSLK